MAEKSQVCRYNNDAAAAGVGRRTCDTECVGSREITFYFYILERIVAAAAH